MKSKVNSSIDANVDEIEEESSHQKGAKLEIEFARYMKNNLGYHEAVTKMDVLSAEKATGTEVDVIGFKTDPRGQRLRMIGIVYIFSALLLLIIKGIYTYDKSNTMSSELSIAISIVSLFTVCFGFYTVYDAKKFESENGWVECKNRKTKAIQKEVDIMLSQLKHYKNSNDKKHKFTELYFVSASGFVDNALEYAKKQNIRCFIKNSDGEFLEV
jgi:hypothetical protein